MEKWLLRSSSNVKAVNDVNAVKVDLQDDGTVYIYHTDQSIIDATKERIEQITREVEEGRVYTGKVTKVEDFGCFVELWPGCEGLCHVSQLAWERVDKPSSMFKVGDEIIVRAEGYDNRNRLNLSRKSALPKPAPKEPKKEDAKKEEVKETKKETKVETTTEEKPKRGRKPKKEE